MKRIYVADLPSNPGKEVTIAGWMHAFRRVGKVVFLLLRDASGIGQVVVDSQEQLDTLAKLQDESVLEVHGTVVAEAQALGGFEIHNPQIRILSPVTAVAPFPINKPVLNVSLDTFLDNAAFGLRHPQKRAIFRLCGEAMSAFRAFLRDAGFTEIATPKIVAAATESGANVFKLDYFGRDAYLAQSPQFYKQMMVGVFERVFEIAPVFRAEPHSTSRHLNEYVSMDVEFGFIEDHHTVMDLLTDLIRAMIEHLLRHCSSEVHSLRMQPPAMPDKFPVIYFPDALELIYRRYGEDCRQEPDLSPQHERWLCEWALEQYKSDFLFVTGFPASKRPFYTHPNPEDTRYTNSFDLLFRGMELVTGGQRLHLYEDYVKALADRNLPLEPFAGYLDAFRYGMPPHGGFAIGLERFVMLLLNRQNLRETALFPRDLNRITP
ncbi:MAG TPA: aspartate--tRNA(Asn) ligase [Acidobacteriota bacterium]|nr:aspartate--tRNA(Asn) ligase [Acidobacteriota bacterium]